MKVAGIVAEYNPFHSGHAYLIDRARANGYTHIVAAMSGNFVQRGDIAVCDKWARTKMALLSGADLILETPIPFAMSTAETFAFGSVSILNALGVIDALVFGSESADIKSIENIVDILLNPAVSDTIKAYMKEGVTFAAARQKAVCDLLPGTETILESPNDNLAVNYLASLNKLNAKITPLAIKRTGAAHDSKQTQGGFASATAIRQNIFDAKSFMPPQAFAVFQKEIDARRAPCRAENAELAFLSRLRALDDCAFACLPDISEGLENRMKKAIRSAKSLRELFDTVKTKRYSHARIRRLALSAALGLSAELTRRPVPYIRVLGFNNRGKELLTAVKTRTAIPIITRAAQLKALPDASAVFDAECRADDLYGLCSPEIQPCGRTFTEKIIVNPSETD